MSGSLGRGLLPFLWRRFGRWPFGRHEHCNDENEAYVLRGLVELEVQIAV
jgi:hypothetical protein